MASPAIAQPDVYDEGGYADVAPGEAVPSIDVFYDQLAPYGVWVDEPRLGLVFIPDQADFVPYTDGHWQYTTVGFVWVSNAPFGWATEHYGRWAYSRAYDRWVWAPDTQWGPAWVDWREADGTIGWAPMAPDFVEGYYEPPITAWTFTPFTDVLRTDVRRYYVPRDRVAYYHEHARRIDSRSRIDRREVVTGPPPATLRRYNIEARPQRVDARQIGRMNAGEAAAAATRARERRATIEAQNRRRIEEHPRIREVERKQPQRTQQQPGQPAQPTPPKQPERTQPRPPEQAQPQPPKQPERTPPKQPERTQPRPPEQTQPRPPEQTQPPKQPERPPQQTQPRPPEHAQPRPPEQTQPQPPKQPERPQQAQPRPPEHAQPPKQPEPPRRVEPLPPSQPPKQAPPPRPEPPKAAPTPPPAPKAEPPKAPTPPPAPRAEPPKAPTPPAPAPKAEPPKPPTPPPTPPAAKQPDTRGHNASQPKKPPRDDDNKPRD